MNRIRKQPTQPQLIQKPKSSTPLPLKLKKNLKSKRRRALKIRLRDSSVKKNRKNTR